VPKRFPCLPRSRRGRLLTVLCTTAVSAAVLVGCAEGPDRPVEDQRADNISGDLERHATRRLAFTRYLTLDDCIAVGLRYNLENALKRRQQAIQEEASTRAWWRMLPQFAARHTQLGHDRDIAKQATNLESEDVTKDFTTSTPGIENKNRVNMVWNLLDFGISFYQARQEKATIELQGQELRRARQDLAFQITSAFWRCQAMARIGEHAETLAERIRERREVLQRRIRDNTIPRREGLTAQKRLLTVLSELKNHQREFEKARSELVLLLGMAPGTPIRLAPVDFAQVRRFTRLDVAKLEAEALLSRPELYRADIQERIERDVVRQTALRMLPSPSLVFTYDWERNPYLLYSEWQTLAIKAAWQLLDLPAKAKGLRMARLEREYVKQRRMVLAVAILSQLRLSVIEYHEAADRAVAASRSGQVDQQIQAVTATLTEQGQATDAEMLEAEIDAFFAQMQQIRAYADLRSTVARIRNTIGRDPKQITGPLPVTIRKEKALVAREEQTIWKRDRIREIRQNYRRPPETYGVYGVAMNDMPAVIRRRGGTLVPPEGLPKEEATDATDAAATAADPGGEEDVDAP